MTKKRFLSFFIIFLLMLVCTAALPLSQAGNIAFAADYVEYSAVLDDLSKDSTFNAEDYPAVDDDYSLQVIQIAESADKELIVYVYQPSRYARRLTASSINISTTINDSIKYHNYDLFLANSNGVFYKYIVEDFTVSDEIRRYYNISSILRPFDKEIDRPASGGNTISEVPYAVKQLWTVTSSEGNITYSKTETTVIEITEKYVGYVDLFDGYEGLVHVTGSHTLKHFVAFSTDFPIDTLMEADIQFSLSDYTFSQCANLLCSKHKLYSTYESNIGTPVKQDPITLYADEVASNNQHGYNGHSYTWNKIQSTEEFIADNNNADYKLTSSTTNSIAGTQWVLNFYDVVMSASGNATITDSHLHWSGEVVSGVIILRLKFETEGKPYNLGVVDNKQSGDGKPGNMPATSELGTFFEKIVSFFNGLFDNPLDWLHLLWMIPVAIIAILFIGFVVYLICRLIVRMISNSRKRQKTTKKKPKK